MRCFRVALLLRRFLVPSCVIDSATCNRNLQRNLTCYQSFLAGMRCQDRNRPRFSPSFRTHQLFLSCWLCNEPCSAPISQDRHTGLLTLCKQAPLPVSFLNAANHLSCCSTAKARHILQGQEHLCPLLTKSCPHRHGWIVACYKPHFLSGQPRQDTTAQQACWQQAPLPTMDQDLDSTKLHRRWLIAAVTCSEVPVLAQTTRTVHCQMSCH